MFSFHLEICGNLEVWRGNKQWTKTNFRRSIGYFLILGPPVSHNGFALNHWYRCLGSARLRRCASPLCLVAAGTTRRNVIRPIRMLRRLCVRGRLSTDRHATYQHLLTCTTRRPFLLIALWGGYYITVHICRGFRTLLHRSLKANCSWDGCREGKRVRDMNT